MDIVVSFCMAKNGWDDERGAQWVKLMIKEYILIILFSSMTDGTIIWRFITNGVLTIKSDFVLNSYRNLLSWYSPTWNVKHLAKTNEAIFLHVQPQQAYPGKSLSRYACRSCTWRKTASFIFAKCFNFQVGEYQLNQTVEIKDFYEIICKMTLSSKKLILRFNKWNFCW